MPRKKKVIKSPEENVLDQYPRESLLAALSSFEGNIGWGMMKEFIYYQAAVHGTMANVLVQQTGKQYEACAAGAKAEALREVVDQFMTQLRDKVLGHTGVVETERPEDQVIE
jgi:hypothetical protein